MYLTDTLSYLSWALILINHSRYVVTSISSNAYHQLFPSVAEYMVRHPTPRFRDLGVNEKVVDTGDDEIAVLGNALDTGFSAIAARDRERDQFLAVTATNLKLRSPLFTDSRQYSLLTPMTVLLPIERSRVSAGNRGG
jgi:hypothetical protein